MIRARDKRVQFTKHAHDGMVQERPPVTVDDVLWALEEPDHDDGKEIRKRIGARVIRAYYDERDDEIRIRSVSRTTRWR